MNGVRAFREGYLNADVQQDSLRRGVFDEFSLPEARQSRYTLFWGLYQNNAYQEEVNEVAGALKKSRRLYKHTRGAVNPVHRQVEFFATHLLGGPLDRAAGDGAKVKTCLPIECDGDVIRPALALLWKSSRLAVNKGVIGRFGPCLGDVGLKVCDDADKGRVRVEILHPGHIKWAETEDGRVTHYMQEELRYDPREPAGPVKDPLVDPHLTRRTVIYSEECWVDSGTGLTTYRTYLDGREYDWRGTPTAPRPSTWTVPYRFVPLVLIPHMAVGLCWGMSEVHALVSKALESDDQASGLGDQIRKVIRAPKLITGVKDVKEITRTASQDDSDRGSATFFCVPAPKDIQVGVHDLAGNLDIPGVGAHIDRLVAEMERDFPELRYDLQNINGEASGRALRTARDAITTKIQERRTTYDLGLVEAFQFALAVGGAQGYPGYEAFQGADESPFDDRRLDMQIGHRPVFAPDPLDDSEEFQAEWTAIGAAVQQSGAPLEWVLQQRGYDPEQIASLKAAVEDNAARDLAKVKAQQVVAMGDQGGQGAERQ
jgi:hypothetical protein